MGLLKWMTKAGDAWACYYGVWRIGKDGIMFGPKIHIHNPSGIKHLFAVVTEDKELLELLKQKFNYNHVVIVPGNKNYEIYFDHRKVKLNDVERYLGSYSIGREMLDWCDD